MFLKGFLSFGVVIDGGGEEAAFGWGFIPVR